MVWKARSEESAGERRADPLLHRGRHMLCGSKDGKWIERQIESLNELAETIGRNLTIGWGLNHLTRSLDQHLQTGRVCEQPARPRFVCYAVECLLTKRAKNTSA